MDSDSRHDRKIHLTEDTFAELLQFISTLNPASSTEDDVAFLLQYLKWSGLLSDDVASGARSLGQHHAQAAMGALANILGAPHPRLRCLQLVLGAWSEIDRWINFAVYIWVTRSSSDSPPEGQQAQERVDTFNAIVPFLSTVCKLPDFVDMLSANDLSREAILRFLIFSWLIEIERFMKQDRYDPSLSAAYPLGTIIGKNIESHYGSGANLDNIPPNLVLLPNLSFIPGLEFLRLFEESRMILQRSPADIARSALTLLKKHPVSLDVLLMHLEIICVLAVLPGCADALLAQNSVLVVTQLLGMLTRREYEADSAQKTAECIMGCIMYLSNNISMKEARMALLAGVLPSILRSKLWISDDSESFGAVINLVDLISRYLI
ncbi:hypothetical protein FB451DRAFT_1389443 [Mycena latifolia]|nr:hypothetical protein FB451DRAFT_1389443 [Mycena latifolia]